MRRLFIVMAIAAAAIGSACGGGGGTPEGPRKLRFALIPKALDIPVFNYANTGAQRPSSGTSRSCTSGPPRPIN
jgi:hypothetical protein